LLLDDIVDNVDDVEDDDTNAMYGLEMMYLLSMVNDTSHSARISQNKADE